MATLTMVRTRRQSGIRRTPRINFGQCFGIEIEREADGWLIRIPEIGGVTYARRRAVLLGALTAADFRVERSEAGLYLWATRDEDCWDTISWLAGLGIVVAPGDFYGEAGRRHVRVALTATDERVQAAAFRITNAR